MNTTCLQLAEEYYTSVGKKELDSARVASRLKAIEARERG